MSDSPTLSVVIPMHNSERYIIRCLESVVNQTLKSIQVIVVDDCSNDGGLRLVDDFAQKHPMVEWHTTYMKLGPGGARNFGKQFAKGNFIAFLDSDDWVDSSAYKSAISCMLKDESDMGLFGIKREYSQPTESQIRYRYIDYNCVTASYALTLLAGRHHTDTLISPLVGNKVFRRTAAFDSILFPENAYYEDAVFLFRCLLKMKKVSIIPDAYLHYFQHASSITHIMEEDHIEKFLVSFVALRRELQETSLYEQKRECYFGVFKHCLSSLLRQIDTNLRDESTQREYLLKLYELLKSEYSAKEILELVSLRDIFNLFPYKNRI